MFNKHQLLFPEKISWIRLFVFWAIYMAFIPPILLWSSFVMSIALIITLPSMIVWKAYGISAPKFGAEKASLALFIAIIMQSGITISLVIAAYSERGFFGILLGAVSVILSIVTLFAIDESKLKQ